MAVTLKFGGINMTSLDDPNANAQSFGTLENGSYSKPVLARVLRVEGGQEKFSGTTTLAQLEALLKAKISAENPEYTP